MPEEVQEVKKETPKVPRFYSEICPPPIKAVDVGNKPIPVYGWEYNEEKHEMEPVFTGEYIDRDKDIQAARQETLTEMMARMPGKSPLEKVEYAVNTGLVVPPETHSDGSYKTYDMRSVPSDIAEAQAMQRRVAQAYESLPPEIKNAEGSTLEEKLANFLKQAQASQAKKEEASQEGDKQ